MTIHKKGNDNKLTLYVRSNKKEIVDKARKILERENSSLSQFLIEKLEALVNLHSPGNPQQTLPHMIEAGGPYVAPQKCYFCPREPVGFALSLQNNKKYPACSKHLEELRAHPKWRVSH